MLKYAMIADDIRARIQDGTYTDDSKLPIEDAMMLNYGVSRQTIRKAMDVLESEGIVERKRGSGTFVRRARRQAARTGIVGIIATDISGYIFPLVLRGIEKVLTKNEYITALRSTRNHIDVERQMLEYYIENPVDGLIIDGTKTALPNPNIELYRKLQDARVPMVFVNGPYAELGDVICVSMDDEGGAAILTKHLIDSGCKRIGGIFQSDFIQGLRRYSGFTKTCVREGLPIIDQGILWFNNESKNDPLRRYYAPETFKLISDLDGMLCFNDAFSCNIMQLFRSMGDGRVPKVVGFDDMMPSPFPPQEYVTLPHAKEELGAIAARKLISLIRGEKVESELLKWGSLKLVSESMQAYEPQTEYTAT